MKSEAAPLFLFNSSQKPQPESRKPSSGYAEPFTVLIQPKLGAEVSRFCIKTPVGSMIVPILAIQRLPKIVRSMRVARLFSLLPRKAFASKKAIQ